MVYVDEIRPYSHGPKIFHKGACHLTADTLDELHEIAGRIGLKRAWFQDGGVPHYDLTISRRKLAIKEGAIFKAAAEQARERMTRRQSHEL